MLIDLITAWCVHYYITLHTYLSILPELINLTCRDIIHNVGFQDQQPTPQNFLELKRSWILFLNPIPIQWKERLYTIKHLYTCTWHKPCHQCRYPLDTVPGPRVAQNHQCLHHPSEVDFFKTQYIQNRQGWSLRPKTSPKYLTCPQLF